MTLKEWLQKQYAEDENKTHAYYAEKLGISKSTIRAYIYYGHKPADAIIEKIKKLSEGEVTRSDFIK